MSATKGSRVADANATSIKLEVAPYTGHSVITVVISTRSGRERVDRRLARWHVPLTRADLAGHSTDDVLLVVLGMVMQRIELRRSDPADWHATRPGSHTAVGPGAPAPGATGAVQDPLPGLGPTLKSG